MAAATDTDTMHMLEAHRLGTSCSGFQKFDNSVYTSREKVMSLLAVYASLTVCKKRDMKGPQLMQTVLFDYERLVKRFNDGYGECNVCICL